MEEKMDNHLQYSRKWKKSLTAGILLALALGGTGYAMPTGGQIQSGQGSIAQNGKNMTVTQNSGKMAVDWTQFNIARDEAVKFAQPGRDAVALNRITGGQKSVIDGALSANGNLFLVNPNGVVFGKTSTVDVGSLVASTAQLNDSFMKNFASSTANLNLTIGDGNSSAILNEGSITAQGGLVALHAAQVENTGTISNAGGQVALAAAKQLTLSPDSDGKLNYAVDGELAQAKALNSGRIQADGGYVVMTAKSADDVLGTVVNNTGTIEARTLRKDEKGQILLDGGQSGQVEVSGTLDASGTDEGQSAGSIKVIGQKTLVHDNTSLLAKGNVDGGKIETSGDVLDLGDGLTIDAGGVNGKHGEWLLDPLEVVISASKPSSADHEYGTIAGDTNGKTKNNVIFNDPPSKQNATNAYNSTTWIDSGKVSEILAGGTDVIIQAISSSGAASITLDSPIDITVSSSASKNPTFTLEANRNITINENITAKSGGKGLNIMLNADTDGDGIGAVIMNADVTTNGGWFKSATGGSVTHKYGTSDADKKNYGTYNGVTVGGGPNHDGSSVGTYFGGKDTATKAENRFIQTSGGAITLNGEVAIGLNGGTLTLDTGGGDLTVTGLINSGNSYKAYIYGTDDWNNNKMIQDMVDQYLKDGTVPAYHYIGITYDKDKDGNLIKDGNGYKWSTKKRTYADGANNIHYVLNALTDTTTASGKSGTELSAINPQWYTSTKAGEGYDSFVVDKASTISVDEYLAYVKKSAPGNWSTKYNALTLDAIKNDTTKMETLKSDIAELIAHNWFLAEQIAENGTKGGANVRDSYLATITTRLENSLSTPNGQHTLWVGGRGSGVRGRTVTDDKNNPATWGPSDPTLMDGFYWVTGPEGASSTYTDSEGNPLKYDAGTKFWDTASSDWKTGKNGEKVYGLDPTWSTYTSGGKKITQPDNNGPFLTVGYGSDNQWDDANFGGETTWGFVQETNLANSSLKINTGKGAVNLKGDIGKGQALDTLSIEGGTVQIGDKNNKVTDYHNGTVYVDHGLKITGTGNVTVGGEIHSGESPETDTSTSLDDQYKDNVTIQSGGNLEVHGITSNTYDVSNTDGTKTTRGGKIKLVSTGTEGVITLGDGVDYNGKNTNGGVLKAASTANDSVVIDAQGAKSKFVNETSSTKAIDTQGKWKIYSASPERNTFGKNLDSETDAQWTTNSTKFAAADSNENKFIFQTTPTITLYVEDKVKTYGDDVTDQLPGYMMNREEFTGVDGKLHNVNEFTDAFQEKEYTNYISIPEGQSITVTSVGKDGADGAVGTATRTGGTHAATEKSGADGKNAVYDLNVNLNEATAKDGYVLKNENATLEIVKRQASITGSGTQIYGDTDGTIKNWTDTKNNIANGSAVTYDTSVKSGSAYTDNQKGRNTADYGTYEDSVSFDNLKITDAKGNEVNIADNYDLTTTGTIDVAKAKLTVNTDGKTTTYGTVDESYTSKLDDSTKALNGDDANKLISDLGLTYKTDAYQDSDGDGKYDRTNHVKYTSDGKDYDSYALDVANTNTLKNYEVTVNGSTVTLERAKATVDTDKVTTDYGKVDTSYTSHFNTALNGDKEEDLLKQLDLSYSTDAYKDADHTNNVKDGGYDLKVQAKGSLTYNDYDVTVNDSNVTLNKVNLTVNPEDIHRIYGQAKEVQEDAKTAYNLSGFVNGDTKDTVDATNKDGKTIDQLVTVTNNVSNALKDDGTHTQNASAAGYDMETTASGDLTNYNIVVGDSKKVYLDKAELFIDTDSNSKVYGNWQGVKNDVEGAAHIRDEATSVVNGDKATDLMKEMGLTTSSEALIKNADGTYKTNHVKDGGYAIDTTFADTITNYTVKRGVAGTETLTKAQATVDTDNVTTTYGTVDKNYTSHFNTAANGDDPNKLLEDLKLTYQTEAYKDDPHTNDVKEGGYDLNVAKTQELGDYDVTVKNANVTLNKAKLVIDTDSNTKVYGDWQGVKNDVEGAAHIRDEATSVVNGDDPTKLVQEMGLKTSSEALIQNADGTYKTNHVKEGGYAIKTEFLNTIKNYDVSRGTDGVETLTKAKAVVDTDEVTTTYGTVDKNYTSHFKDALNGDDAEQLLKNLSLTYKTDAYTDDTHTNNVKEGGYNLEVAKTTDLGDYEVTVNPSNVNIEKATLVIDTTGGTKDYGNVAGVQADLDKAASFHVKGSDKQTVNGDDEDEIKNALNISVKSNVLLDNGTRTNNVNDGGYEIKANYTPELQNYKVETGTVGKEQLNRVDLYVDSNDLTKSYGDAQGVLVGLDSKERNTLTGLVNGDEKKEDSIRTDIGIKNSSSAVYTKNGKSYTKDVGEYGIDTELTNGTITNYNVKTRNAGKVTLTPVDITVDNEMIQTYGSQDKSFKEVTDPALPNGDKISTDGLKMAPKANGKYETNKGNRTTADAGTYKDDLAFSGGGIVHEDGTTEASKNYNVTIKGDIIVNKADLHVNTKDVTTPFGTVKFTTSGVQGLTNGDEKNVSDLKFNYGSYGNAYLDNNSYTNAPGRYEFTTETTNQYLDFLKNYNILGGDATVTITPVEKPVKPDITPDRPTPIPEGKGTVDEPSIREFRGAEDHDNGGRTWYREKKSIPFFKVLDGKVTNYGTFDVESMPEKVEITPSGMRLPEPDQEKTQHREYTTTLTLPGGEGTYRLVYNGVSFNIHAVDAAARQLLEAGDPKKNKELSEAALHTGFQKMGLGLEDLKAVYVRFN